MKLEAGNVCSDIERWKKSCVRKREYSELSENYKITFNYVQKIFKLFIEQYNLIFSIKEIKRDVIYDFIDYCEKKSKNQKLTNDTKNLYINSLYFLFRHIHDYNDEQHDFKSVFSNILFNLPSRKIIPINS